MSVVRFIMRCVVCNTMAKIAKERAVPQIAYVTPERMRLARKGGLQNFSGDVNKMLEPYIEKARARAVVVAIAKRDFNDDAPVVITHGEPTS